MTDWSHPVEVSDLLMAFPADLEGLLPPMEEIPEEFVNPLPGTAASYWVDLHRKMFLMGANPEDFTFKDFIGFLPHDGVDSEMAWRQLVAINDSYQPKHQHKEAGWAYLASLFFITAVFGTTGKYRTEPPVPEIEADLNSEDQEEGSSLSP